MCVYSDDFPGDCCFALIMGRVLHFIMKQKKCFSSHMLTLLDTEQPSC